MNKMAEVRSGEKNWNNIKFNVDMISGVFVIFNSVDDQRCVWM